MKPVLLTAVVFLVLSLMWKTVLKIETKPVARPISRCRVGTGRVGRGSMRKSLYQSIPRPPKFRVVRTFLFSDLETHPLIESLSQRLKNGFSLYPTLSSVLVLT